MYKDKLQRKWQEQKPAVYDKKTRIVALDIVKESKTEKVDDGKELVTEGWSYYPVQIDSIIDYAHIKSQLIEAGYAPKDEFAEVINAMSSVLLVVGTSDDIEEVKNALEANEDVQSFVTFCEYRYMCAKAAKDVLNFY